MINEEENPLTEEKAGFSRVSMALTDDNKDNVDAAIVGSQPKVEERLYANKFKSTEDLEKSYLELQAKLSSNEKSIPEEPKDGPQGMDYEKTFNEAFKSYEDTGEVSNETIEKFTKMGIPKEVVDNYVANFNATQELNKIDILNTVGGQNAFDEISNWAVLNLKEAEINGFNKIIDSGDIDQIKLTLGNLKARMGSSRFVTPDVKGGYSSEGSFESKGSMLDAINDKRYATDSAYRASVQMKIARSSKL